MSERPLILSVVSRALYPLLLVLAGWLWLRGHNEPGGGFIGGMVAVAATALLAVARGSAEALRRLPLGPLGLAASGVLLALLSGVPALLRGQPFLTHQWIAVPLGVTALDLSTVMLFDGGVLAAVWGALGGLCAHALAIDEETP